MTMDQHVHPDDELLASFADGEERAAAAHVETCDRCAVVVRDLRTLRASLSDLPDIAPSRPFRFLPPVEAPPAPGGGFGVLVRRLFAPAVVAGAALVLVGSVGMAASAGGPGATSAGGVGSERDDRGGDPLAAASAENAEGTESQTYNVDSASPGGGRTAMGSESSAPGVAGALATATPAALPPASESSGPNAPSTPWLAMTIMGAALLLLTTVLRWTVVPRAPDPPLYPGA
ncbi:MAG: hypothetical protein ABI622_02280 [Chloroflexota bacterium]